MSDEKPVEAKAKKTAKAFYFKNRRYAGLSVVVKNENTLEGYKTVRFTPRTEKWQGDDVRVGYLMVEDPEIAKLVKATKGTEVIDEKEFVGK